MDYPLSDIHINEAPIVCFTETQMTENKTMPLHPDLLQRYETIANSNTDKSKSFLLCCAVDHCLNVMTVETLMGSLIQILYAEWNKNLPLLSLQIQNY